MKLQSFTRSAAALALGLALNVARASAQGNPTGNSSDVTGPSVTGGEVAGGAFAPNPAPAGTTPALASPQAQANVVAAASALTTALTAGSMTSVGGVAIPAAVQAMVLAVLTTNAPTTGAAASLAAALSGAGTAASAALPSLLVSLSGLANNPSQLAPAIGSYNEFVQAASIGFLVNPPPAFLAVQSVLAQLSSAARAAQ